MNGEYIPPATAAKIASECPVGTRHQVAKEIAFSLIGNQMPQSSVFTILRNKFPADVTDRELTDIIAWSIQQHPEPSAPASNSPPRVQRTYPFAPPPQKKRSPIEQADWWSGEASATIEDILAKSPIHIPANRVEASQLAIASLYQESDFINVVCAYIEDGGKAKPCGPGKTMARDQWVEWMKSNGVPKNKAGAWMRINPCSPAGSGKDGAYTDADMTSHRYLLVESDVLPLNKQLALLSRFRLPVAAIILSGGASAHAWVKIQAASAKQYRELCARLLAALEPFGFDQNNKNPSRLCRLPGAIREIGAAGTGEQKLLHLNPGADPLTEESLKRFEESLACPVPLEKPLLPIARQALNRYEYMMANRGKLGVPSGIPALDEISGGFKNGQTIVVAGESGGGKTTLGLHFVLSALNAGIGVLLFSLEMDREEIFDLIVSSRCRIDRNKFNNGAFTEYDIAILSKTVPQISSLPLYLEDSAFSTPDQIRARALQLKADNRIGLIVVDYIQFVNPGLQADTREQQVASISHSLRALCREVQLPMIVLSQLNDDGKVRESRVITHNANIVMVVKIESDEVGIQITKGRGIPLGRYKMRFDRSFSTLAPIVQDDATYSATRGAID